MDVIKDKNPTDQDKLTPLHLAAENGHEQICRLIMNAVLDKNPKVCNNRSDLNVKININNK